MLEGSGYGNVNILTPSEAMGDAATAQQRVTQSQLATALMPDEIAQSGTRTASSALALQQAQKSALAKNIGTDQELIANAAALATDAAGWDDAMQTLADKGVPAARQFIGRFSTSLQERISKGYGATTPTSALAGMTAPSGQSALAGVPGPGADDLDARLAGLNPQQRQNLVQQANAYQGAIQRIETSSDPSAQWDKEAVAMGHPDQVGAYQNGQGLAKLKAEIEPFINHIQARGLQSDMGVPAPKPAAKIDKVGDQMFAVDETDPSHPKVTPLTQGKSVFVGTNADGHGVYYNPDTHEETIGTATMATSRYNRGGNSVYAAKQAAWLSVHPGDAAGALAYAGGTGGKNLSPEQIQVAAMHQAVSELSADTLGGNPPKDPEAFVRSRSQEIAGEISAKAAPAQDAPGSPPATPPSAPTMKSGYPVLSAAQSHAAAADPKNKGKGYYGADGVFRRF